MEKRERQEGITTGQAKGRTQRWQSLQPNLARVNEAARRSGQTRFTALLHHIDVGALERAFQRQRRAASPGVDRVTVEDYERNLEANLQRLHKRVHSGQYWPKPVRRTYIPKADGNLRPLGIPTLEDKIVQGAVAEVLNAVYEADFVGFSHGFRPGRSPHSALAALDKALMTQHVNFVLDVDIRTFFDSVDHGWLMRMLAHRIADSGCFADQAMACGRCPRERPMESGEAGAPQGSGSARSSQCVPPLVRPLGPAVAKTPGSRQVIVCRYADDVLGCESRRMEATSRTPGRLAPVRPVAPEGKTRLIESGGLPPGTKRPPGSDARRPSTFSASRTTAGPDGTSSW